MPGETSFAMHFWDYFAFLAFFVLLSAIGFWVVRKERTGATEDFLAGKRLPWYVVGSFIASNISTEHFVGMIGVAIVYGIFVAMSEWGNVLSFTLLIRFFVSVYSRFPFISSKVC
jgi:SSS family solute:Na+ symporter